MLNLRDGHPVRAEYRGDLSAVSALTNGQAQPLSLASADFDEDGVEDLLCGYAAANGAGIVAVHRGNNDALWPYGAALRHGEPTPFLPDVRVFRLPEAPDFLGTGDFDADGHWDIVAAKRGGSGLWLLRGDGRGGFSAPERLELDGAVTAFATGEINRIDGLADFAVATNGQAGARVLVFESPAGAWRAEPESFDLPAAASGLAMATLDRGARSLVAAAGHDLVVIHGRDRKLTLERSEQEKIPAALVTRQSFPFELKAIALGSFTSRSAELAALGDDGKVHVLGYVAAASHKGPEWEVRSEIAPPGGQTLMAGHISAAGSGDLIVLDREARKLHILSPAPRTSGRKGLELVASLDVSGGSPAAVLPMRLNQHPLNSLVELGSGIMQPLLIVSNPGNTFTVSNTLDGGPGSLRQAITDANSAIGASSIVFNIPTSDPGYNPLTGAFRIQPLPENPGAPCTNFAGGSPALPSIGAVITLDGYTQPGASPNTLVNGDNATVLIQIDGAQDTTTGGVGIQLGVQTGFTLRGLSLTNWSRPCSPDSGSGVDIFDSSGGFVEGNIIGLDPTGSLIQYNTWGIYDNGASTSGIAPGNVVGGTSPQARNLISGNYASGYTSTPLSLQETVEGNYIGTDRTGTLGFSFGNLGVSVVGSESIIGGTAPGTANLISGNAYANVYIVSDNFAQNNLVQGNLIGTDYTGTKPLTAHLQADGVWLSTVENGGGAQSNTIGGTTPTARNIISGNPLTGVAVDDFAQDNVIQGNYIGTDITGAMAIPNGIDGVSLGVAPTFTPNDPNEPASNTTIGGAVAGAANLISGNAANGIEIQGILNNGDEAPLNLIQGNLIGTDVTGSAKLPNQGVGVLIGAGSYNTTVGGYDTLTRNTIAFNGKDGVSIDPGPPVAFSDPPTQFLSTAQNNQVLANAIFSNGGAGVRINSGNENPISRNSIYGNAKLGIDIGAGNPNINSNCQSTATGANNQQNAPVLTTGSGSTLISATATDPNGNTSNFSNCAAFSGTAFTAAGTFNGLPNTKFTIEFFQNAACDASGFGQGQTFVGSTTVTTGSNCSAAISQSLNLMNADMSITLKTVLSPFPGTIGFASISGVVTNNGGATATNVTVTDTLPASMALASATATQGTCQIIVNSLTCNLGTMAPGATSTIAIQYTPLNANSATDTISVSATQPDSNMANNTASVTVNPSYLFPNLAQFDPPSVVAGSPDLSLNLIGSNFVLGVTTVKFNGTSLQETGLTTLTSNGFNFSNTGCAFTATQCQQLTVFVPKAMLTTAGTPDIVVTNPAPGGGSFDDVNIESQRFTILASCSYAVTPNTPQDIDGTAQTLEFSITPTPNACTWNAASSVPWMFVQNPGDYYGSSTGVSFNVLANGPTARSGNITLGGQTVTINQSAGACSMTLSAMSESYSMAGGTGEFAILERPASCSSWTATSDSSWLTITSATASDSDNGTITYSVAANNGAARAGHISVPGAGTFTVQQLGAPSPCDVNQDAKTNALDTGQMVREGLGQAAASNDLNKDGTVNVLDIQIVINASIGLGCSAS